MKEEEEIICKFMYEFAKTNWNKINLEKIDLIKVEKDKFLYEVLTDVQTALWILTEVSDWAMDKKYLRELYVYRSNEMTNNFSVIKTLLWYFK